MLEGKVTDPKREDSHGSLVLGLDLGFDILGKEEADRGGAEGRPEEERNFPTGCPLVTITVHTLFWLGKENKRFMCWATRFFFLGCRRHCV